MNKREGLSDDQWTIPDRGDIAAAQHLRLRRFSMAIATHVVVILAMVLIQRLGLERMTTLQWVAYVGMFVLGNVVFATLFVTGWNLRFGDPSLTREQIVWAALAGMIPLYGLPGARPLVLMFFLPAYSFGMLRLSRRAYAVVVGLCMALYAGVLGLEHLRGRPGFDPGYELFVFILFGLLLGWFAAFGGYVSHIRRRLRAQTRRVRREMEDRRRVQEGQEELIAELRQALAQVKTLSGLLPICASCKKIRDDEGYWNQLETYIDQRADVRFSHSLCPECRDKLYPKTKNNDEE